MALTVGSRLGHYDVTALIGEGGMGQVYRATDTKLKRQVALKILPEAFSADPERLARFQREAEVLASLNHPNIAAIHGLEEADDTRALVLELVEGPTLADRIKRGPIPLDEALPIAKQIAEALEAAHEAGVIHRDLKPANIKVRDDGTVKVLDFGLAKALDPSPTGDPSQSPTLTAAATQMGVIMGTAAYMSPEQAAGKTVDKRGDVWSFGVVLFEMLTGQRLFTGETVSHVLGAVLQVEPKWDALPTATPPLLKRLLRRCLQKERKRRLRDIGDAVAEFDEGFAAQSTDQTTVAPVAQAGRLRQALPWVAGVLLALVASLTTWSLARPAAQRPPPPSRFVFASPPGLQAFAPTLSPDGRTIAFDGWRPGQSQVYIRPLNELEVVPVRGAERTFPLGFSPDGEWILVSDDQPPRMLKRVPLAGGPGTTIAEHPWAGADWGPDDTIVQGSNDGLLLVPASGGESTQLTMVSEGELGHYNPKFLPSGQAVLFFIWTGDRDTSQLAVYDFDTGEHRTMVSGVSPQFAASGHLVFWRDGSLWAAGFDPERLEVRGNPAPVVEEVRANPSGFATYAVGVDGILVYVPERAVVASKRSLVWVDRNGDEEPIGLPPRAYNQPQLSPDGRRIAVDTPDGDNDVFLYDLDTQVEEQFTFAPDARDQWPLWSPDGSRILFSSNRHGGELDLYVKLADGSGTAERVPAGLPAAAAGTDWVADGKTVLFGGSDIHILRLGTDAEPETLLETDDTEAVFTVSPNGRWIAYKSNESGEEQIYVRPFPDVSSGGQRLISDEPGATDPLWGHDGRELFYLTPDTAMAVPVETGDTFQRGTPRQLFSMAPYYQGANLNWDLSADGQRFLMVKRDVVTGEDAPSSEIIVVQNWFEELTRLVPTE